MDFDGSYYYKLNRILLLSVGLWPYEKSVLKKIKTMLSPSLFVSYGITMLMKIMTSKCDTVVMLRILSLIIPCIVVIVKYVTFLLLPATIKKLMEWVQNDWNTLKDVTELEIIRKYANIGRLCTIIFSVFGYSCAFGILVMVCSPSLLDIVVPLNVSRERRLPAEAEYFVDQKQYFYTIFCHMYITIVLGITVTLATESLYIAYVQHACGMFKIASYRMQRAFDQRVLCVSPLTENITFRKRIIAAIKIHKRALDFYDFLWSNLALSYFVILFIGVASLSVSLFRVFHTIITTQNFDELVISSLYVLAHFFYIFCGGYVGQIFIDHSIDVYENICDTRWYRIPIQGQRLMLFILHRSGHSCKLTTGGIFVLSLEGFSTLIATSISYFMMLLSVEH